MDVCRYMPRAGCLLTHILCAFRPFLCPQTPNFCHETVSQALPKQLLLQVLQLNLRYSTHPQKPHSTVEHGLWA